MPEEFDGRRGYGLFCEPEAVVGQLLGPEFGDASDVGCVVKAYEGACANEFPVGVFGCHGVAADFKFADAVERERQGQEGVLIETSLEGSFAEIEFAYFFDKRGEASCP